METGTGMDVLTVDRGGGGLAVIKKLAQSADVDRLFTTIDNPGVQQFAETIPFDITDIDALAKFVLREKIGLTFVGADDSLAEGIVDRFRQDKLLIVGPTVAQDRVEADREFAKQKAEDWGVPLGPHAEFRHIAEAMKYALGETRKWPVYAKLNGLARGKGAKECATPEELEFQLKTWHKAGLITDNKPVVIEDFVAGEEASHHAWCDGKTHLSFPFLLRDHKAIAKGSRYMTGGMGTVGPLSIYSPEDSEELGRRFVDPVVKKLGFQGILFSGLKGPKASERLLEWNARKGDPEIQIAMRLLKSDLVPILMACAIGELDKLSSIKWREDIAMACLVMAAPGYPTEQTQLGGVIEGIDEAAKIPGVEILHAGTKKINKQITVVEGRALNVVAEGDNLAMALDRAFRAAQKIHSDPELYVREDVGQTALGGI